MRRKLRPAAFPGVNSLTMQLTRTVSGAARESTPNSGGTGRKKTGAPGNSTPPLATVVVVVSMKQMTVSFWADSAVPDAMRAYLPASRASLSISVRSLV